MKPFLEVKITRYDSSKQERKSHQNLLLTLQLLRKERHHEEIRTYISQVSMHAYQSECISFNIVRSVFHHHLLGRAFYNPISF